MPSQSHGRQRRGKAAKAPFLHEALGLGERQQLFPQGVGAWDHLGFGHLPLGMEVGGGLV